MRYKLRKCIVEATQWFKMGDHPAVKSCSSGGKHYCFCNASHAEHGHAKNINGRGAYVLVCPGQWIITDSDGILSAIDDEDFKQLYEPANQ